MTRTHHHHRGDNTRVKKCRAGSKQVPRKWWTEGKLTNRFCRKANYQNDLRIVI